MFAFIAAFLFLLALVFHLAGAPHESWLQPEALLYAGLALLALHEGGAGWQPWRRG